MNPKNEYASVSNGEKRRLTTMARELEKLNGQRESILTEVRAIIGFSEPSRHDGIEVEMYDIFRESVPPEMVFVAYAQANRKRWELEKTLEKLKSLMKEMNIRPESLDWSDVNGQ